MIGAVVRAGWMNLRHDKAALVMSFVVPIVFFTIFAAIFGAQGRDRTEYVKVAIVDEDHSNRSRRMIDALAKENALKLLEAPPPSRDGAEPPPFDRATAESYVRSGKVPVAVVIPKGFGTARVQFGPSSGGGVEVELLADSSDPIAPQIVNGLLQKTVMTAVPDLFMSGGIDAVDRLSGGLTDAQKKTLDRNMGFLEKVGGFQGSGDEGGGAGAMLLGVNVVDVLGETKKSPLVAFYAAGIGVMFLLFTAANAGGTLLEESESGTLDRILTTRLTLRQLLLGKLVYVTLLGVVQLTVMFVWGALAFDLELIPHIAGFVIMAVPSALACASFGMVLAAVSRSRAQLSAITTLAVLTISALGGSMFPRFLMPESLQRASLVLFNSWALEGFTNVFWREEPLSSLVPHVSVLLGTAILLFALAWRLTRRLERT